MLNVSVVTVVLNAARTIRHCIESVRNQTQPVEHIIIDGCSTDGTFEIIQQCKSKFTKVISEKDRGIYDGMNKGLLLASNDVIGFLNADDLYAGTDIISKVLRTFVDHKVDSCYGDLIYVDPKETNQAVRQWRAGKFNYRRFYWGWMPPHPTFFVRKRIYEKYGNFNLALGSAADYELMLRFLVKHRISTAYIPEVIVKMRTGGISNASVKNRLMANRNDRLAWKINGLTPYPLTLLFKPLRKVNQYFCRKKTV